MPHATRHKARNRAAAARRRGAATLDYALLLGVLLPIVAVVIGIGGWIMKVFYGRLAVLLSWPFM